MLNLTMLLAALAVAAPSPTDPCDLDFVVPVPRHQLPLDPNYHFGEAVATQGDILAVGMPRLTGGGAVAVFKKVPLGWALQDYLQSTSPHEGDLFGADLDLSDNVLAIGAWASDAVRTDAGGVWVHRFDAATGDWAHEATLNSLDVTVIQAGVSVSAYDDTIVFGTGSNRVDTYRFINGAWTEQTPLFAPESGNVSFGDAVAVHGDLLAVADDRHSVPGVSKAGRVYTYARNGVAWDTGVTIELPIPTSTAVHFGEELDLHGSWLIAGAHHNDSATSQPGGMAHVYELATDATIVQHQPLAPVPGVSGDSFGRGVAVRDSTIVVGAPGENNNTGAAYQFDLDVNGDWQLTESTPQPPGFLNGEGYFGLAVDVDSYLTVGAHRPFQSDDTGLVFIAVPCDP